MSNIRYLIASALLFVSACALAEPFLGIETGFKCSQCHVNPTGGGLRTPFGAIFSQTQLPARQPDNSDGWAGSSYKILTVGANARFSGRQLDTDGVDDNFEFDTDRVTLYLSADVNENVRLYIDEQIAPGSTFNREAWVQLRYEQWYLKAGKMFLPFGLRIEDDKAFIRQSTGVNFNNADDGVEFGYEDNDWSGQLSISNGTSGQGEVDDGKQVNLRVERITDRWRLGVSGSHNDTDAGDRTMYGVHTGFRTGIARWLLEYDWIEDDGFVFGDLKQEVAFLETDLKIRTGHYVRLTVEMLSFDRSGLDDRYRYGLDYKYFPMPFTELRLGYRTLDSDSSAAFLNSDEYFMQLHVYF